MQGWVVSAGTGTALPCPAVVMCHHTSACLTCPLQYPEADVLTSSDHLMNTVTDEGLERWPEAGSAANIGIMLFRPKGHDLAAVRQPGCLGQEPRRHLLCVVQLWCFAATNPCTNQIGHTTSHGFLRLFPAGMDRDAGQG